MTFWQYFLLIGYLIFLIIVLGLFISVIVGLIMARGVPFVSTPRRKYRQILSAVDLKPGEKIYDLGCGKASLLILAAKEFGAIGIGYELSLWPYLWSRFNILISRAKVEVRMKNFFKADLSDADVIYCYLFPSVMARLEPKFAKELKPTTRVVSYGFKLPNTEPVKIVETRKDGKQLERIFVYRFGN
jgi:hypothetical protein